jgi:4-amino-4-deoxy-L-arabinose transferase-like glycosyltransferase
MIFYSGQISVALLFITFLGMISVYVYVVKNNLRLSLLFLLLAGFLLRLLMAALDPFLHNWDEKFHALVAKNLMEYPLKPMLRVDPIMPYDIHAWCCNHIWLHKQPLFMWQMAMSMKIFGVNEIAVRLPSVGMGTLSIWLIFDLARHWTKNNTVAYFSALLFSFSFFQLELTSGRQGMDHNDVAFAFYVTAGIWAFTKYIRSGYLIKWGLLLGCFVGCAILNKWLTGLLAFGGWGVYLLLEQQLRTDWTKWLHLLLALLVCLFVFMPWQIYISHEFPVESAFEYKFNKRHLSESIEGHEGDYWFHLYKMPFIYGFFLWLFIPIGVFAFFSNRNVNGVVQNFMSCGGGQGQGALGK